MEPDKEAGGGGSFEQMKENVSYDAAHKHHLFFFFFFFSNFFFNFFNFFSSFLSFPLLLIVVYSYFLYFHLHLDLPPHCSSQCRLLEPIVFLPYFSFYYSLVFFFFMHYFALLFFLSFFSFFFFLHHSILFLPSFIFIFFLSTSTYSSSIRASLRFSLLILVSRLLNLDDRCLHNNFPNKVEIVFGIWNGILWYARGSRINCYGIYVILINA